LCGRPPRPTLMIMANDNVRLFETGEVIFKEGEKGDIMYVLLEGAVDLK
jgi:CRP-like cAMP-binding protein